MDAEPNLSEIAAAIDAHTSGRPEPTPLAERLDVAAPVRQTPQAPSPLTLQNQVAQLRFALSLAHAALSAAPSPQPELLNILAAALAGSKPIPAKPPQPLEVACFTACDAMWEATRAMRVLPIDCTAGDIEALADKINSLSGWFDAWHDLLMNDLKWIGVAVDLPYCTEALATSHHEGCVEKALERQAELLREAQPKCRR